MPILNINTDSPSTRRRKKDEEQLEKDRPKSRSSKKPSTSSSDRYKEKERVRNRDRDRERDRRPYNSLGSRRQSEISLDMEKRSSETGSTERLPYPAFNKNFSRETINRKDVNPRLSLYTPDPTILDNETKSAKASPKQPFGAAPPSPPLTVRDPEVRRTKSGHSIRLSSKPSSKLRSEDGDTPKGSQRSTRFQMTEEIIQDSPQKGYDFESEVSHSRSNLTNDTETTPVPIRPKSAPISNLHSAPQIPRTSSPRTPTPMTGIGINLNDIRSMSSTPATDIEQPLNSPQPPPPPPPAFQQVETPRVDYLLQNGGLSNIVPRKLFPPTSQASVDDMTTVSSHQVEASKYFASLHNLLDDYQQVLNKHGSLAVATGYKSVARRLLDRLEKVFNRDISYETCECIICANTPTSPTMSVVEETGLSWGEILEYVSGRRELPNWPPFTIDSDTVVQDLSATTEAPFQKLDEDVPEEYREHYIRQSQKTKKLVRAWLSSQPSSSSSPPQEVDDDTLYFAMLTHLEPEKRKLFTALLRGLPSVSSMSSRAPTPMEKSRSELIIRTSSAIHRLYRLKSPPRDSETALFLLDNPPMHTVLATISAISAQEWDILISGRFDGFLWSGNQNSPSNNDSNISRAATPAFSSINQSTSSTPAFGESMTSRGLSTPAPGAPVAMDEDTEASVLAEVEREIYSAMEALEDAFEALHVKAECVRGAIRDRATGLAWAAAQRNGNSVTSPGIGIRSASAASGITPSQTPSNIGAGGMYDAWDDAWDRMSEIAPDDSASNVSSSRRRKKRPDRRDVATPLTVAEEEEY